ncbi:hypothetical protein [Micromonospora sp. WMMD812]|uniref:hypothetical protein n=1 Tax=Micromonospora sp. WMMD812 TaxID=3015152 RepID=UPI00248A9674|nr:hypothetical protein [Micromonospora sp. WMMD812]WBB65980.1 hypothetical protein O7603_22770 [Micromonospora sp. WMMD812]
MPAHHRPARPPRRPDRPATGPRTPNRPATGPHITAAHGLGARTVRRPTTRRLAAAALALVLPALLVACTADRPTAPAPEVPDPVAVNAARDELAGLAAAAQDRHLTARYTLRRSGEADRTILVTSANDGSWRVDVPGGALGGAADVSIAATPDGLFQCGLPSAARPEPASCVRVGDPDDTLPRRLDPRVQHPFTDWLDVLTDRRAPLSVSPAEPPPGATGACYSVETTSASLNAPLDVGIYCYEQDGTPTAARTDLGTLTLSGPPAPAPATIQLAGPVVDGDPLGTASPSPDPSGSPSDGTS